MYQNHTNENASYTAIIVYPYDYNVDNFISTVNSHL